MMKTTIQKIVIRFFNWMFSSHIEEGDLETIRILSREKLQFAENDIESLRLVAREGLRIRESDVEAIRLVLKGIDEKCIDCLKILCGEKSASPSEWNNNLLLQLKTVAELNRIDDIGDISERFPLSYSQEGEDMILDRFLDFPQEGFFVDVGAHHPKRFSNTYSFYKRGWRGVNIDPAPGVKEMFEKLRPEDISLSVAISNIEGKRDYYLFDEPALNTFSPSLAEEYQREGYKVKEVRPVDMKKLSNLLEECHIDKPIDFMSIDVEDYELPVLQSNDWNRFRPRVLLVEILNFDLNRPKEYPVHFFLLNEGYELFAKSYNTLFYKDTR